MNCIDETGKIYGHLLVLKRLPPDPEIKKLKGRSRAAFLVQCGCGRKFICTGTNLRRGLVTQCAYCAGVWYEQESEA